MVGNDFTLRALLAQLLQQPATERASVQHGLGGRERLGDDHHESAFGIDMLDLTGNVKRINVGYEVELATFRSLMTDGVKAESFIYKFRTKITSSDSNRNDSIESLSRASLFIR